MNELELEGLDARIRRIVKEELDEKALSEAEDEPWGETEDEEVASPQDVAENLPSGSQVDKEKMDELNAKQTKENEKNLKKANKKAKEKIKDFRDQDKGFDDDPEVEEEASEDDMSEFEEQN